MLMCLGASQTFLMQPAAEHFLILFFTLQETLVNLAGLLVSLALVPFITDNAA